MQLYIIRHGIAEDHNPEGDYSRKLTEEGKKKLRTMARFLREKMSLRYIVTSPLVRAVETAEIFGEVLSVPEKRTVRTDALRPGAETAEIITEIEAIGEDTIALVGHNPHLSELCCDLLGSECRGIDLKKGAVARIDFEGRVRKEEGVLKWLITMGLL